MSRADTIQTVIAVTMLATAFASCGAAVAAWRAAKATRLAASTAKSQLVLSLSEPFWSDEFQRACRQLRERKTRKGESYARNLGGYLSGSDVFDGKAWNSDAEKVNSARLLVKSHYYRVWQQASAGALSDSEVTTLCSQPGVELLLELVEPLEKAVRAGEASDLAMFDYFDDLYNKELVRPLRRDPSA